MLRVDAGGRLDDGCAGFGGQPQDDVPGRREALGCEPARAAFAPGGVEDDRGFGKRERWTSRVTARRGGAGIVGGEQSVHRVPVHAHGRQTGLLRGGEVGAEAAGQVHDREAERGEPGGTARGHERVGHHLDAFSGVEPASLAAVVLRGSRSEGQLFRDSSRLRWR